MYSVALKSIYNRGLHYLLPRASMAMVSQQSMNMSIYNTQMVPYLLLILYRGNSQMNCTGTQKVSNSLQRMQVWVLEKLDSSINLFKKLENSVQLQSDSLKFLLKTRDLCSLRMLLINT